MRIPQETEVVVIGGGAMGTSIAYHLAKEGVDTTLFEWRNLASGATGRCGGMVCQLYGRSLNIEKTRERLALTEENNRMLVELQEELGDFEYRRQGLLDVAVDEEEFELFKRLMKIHRECEDDGIELLDRKETLEVMPTLPKDIVGSRYRASDGNLDPFKLTHVLARAAKRYGAAIFPQTKVEEIIAREGKVAGVRTSHGRTKAKWVVNATNGWASFLTKELDIAPVRELAMVTEEVPEFKGPALEMRSGDEFVFGTTQTASGGVVIGGPAPPPLNRRSYYYDERVTLSEAMKCAKWFTTMLPPLRNINIIRCWVGTMAFTPDGIPHIGSAAEKEGLMIAAGFAAGMSQAAVVGRIIADCIIRGKTSFPMEIYDPKRFFAKEIEWPRDPWNLGSLHTFLEKKSQV